MPILLFYQVIRYHSKNMYRMFGIGLIKEWIFYSPADQINLFGKIVTVFEFYTTLIIERDLSTG